MNPEPVPMLLWCPTCHKRHIDTGEFATTRHHHTHSCQHCGLTWRPAIVPTVGVQFLPGFKSDENPVDFSKAEDACSNAKDGHVSTIVGTMLVMGVILAMALTLLL